MTDKNREQLVISVMPDQTLVPEWEKTKEEIFPDQTRCQQKIAQSFTARGKNGLYDLGFQQYHLDF